MAVFEELVFRTGRQRPVAFAFRVAVEGEFCAQALSASLEYLGQRYPSVASRVVEQEDGFSLTTNDALPLSVASVDGSGVTWQDVVAKELAIPFDTDGGPLARFVWIKHETLSEIVAIFHHCVADGLSGVLFLGDLIALIDRGGPDRVASPFPIGISGTWPTAEALLPDEDIRVFDASQWPQPVLPVAEHECNRKVDSFSGSSRFVVRAHSLDRVRVARLIALSKRYGVSMTALLMGAFSRGAADVCGAAQDWVRIVQCPVNLRPYLVRSCSEMFGLFNSTMKMSIDCSPDRDVLTLARDITRQFDDQRAARVPLQFVLQCRLVLAQSSAYRRAIERLPASAVEHDFSLSNVGAIRWPFGSSKVRVREVHGPIASPSECEQIIGVNAFRGCINITHVLNEDGVTSSRSAECFARGGMALERLLA